MVTPHSIKVLNTNIEFDVDYEIKKHIESSKKIQTIIGLEATIQELYKHELSGEEIIKLTGDKLSNVILRIKHKLPDNAKLEKNKSGYKIIVI